MKGIVLSAVGSGSGKTSVATGIMRLLSRKMEVQGYKVGPDFIDPAYHTAATGRVSRNLDTFMMGKEGVRNAVGRTSPGVDICIVEGVRGLFEGVSGRSEKSSTAEMAKVLGFPVVLVLNARSMTRSAAAIVRGFKSFDPELNIAGVILNNVSGLQHERKLLEAMDEYTDVEVVGTVFRDTSKSIESGALGLDSGHRIMDVVDAQAEMVSDLDLDRFMDICERNEGDGLPDGNPFEERDCGMRVAVPRDASFCFYYEDNFDCLRSSGMEIEFYSPVGGDPLPDADAHYIGGGYIENHAAALSHNSAFMDGLRQASLEGVPILAECGGMLSLCRDLSVDGSTYPMGGVLDASSAMTGNRHGPYYVVAEALPGNPFYSGTIKGHSFHYTEVYPNCPNYGFTLTRGGGTTDSHDGLVVNETLGMYTHVHALSVHDWAGGFARHA